ncbi:MAG: hypothetical protein U1F08_13645 [Steroidobacteraceae bacterium]
MFFRRLAAQLAHQNWVAILIEFAIVVAGVFVGTQVSNWNSDRLEQRRATGYLARIEANLRDDLGAAQASVEYWHTVIAYGEEAIDYADHGHLVGGSRWRTVLAFYQASQLSTYRIDDTTYQELRSAGDLGLLRGGKLSQALAGYYVTGPVPSSPHLVQYNPEYRTIVRSYTPVAVSDYIWDHCVVEAGKLGEGFNPDCPSPISDAEAQSLLDRYVGTPGLVPALRFWVSNQKVAARMVESSEKDAQSLLALVRAQLGR